MAPTLSFAFNIINGILDWCLKLIKNLITQEDSALMKTIICVLPVFTVSRADYKETGKKPQMWCV